MVGDPNYLKPGEHLTIPSSKGSTPVSDGCGSRPVRAQSPPSSTSSRILLAMYKSSLKDPTLEPASESCCALPDCRSLFSERYPSDRQQIRWPTIRRSHGATGDCKRRIHRHHQLVLRKLAHALRHDTSGSRLIACCPRVPDGELPLNGPSMYDPRQMTTMPFRPGAIIGTRRGEIFGLKWADLDFGHATLQVRRSFVDGLRAYPK
jgi:hypothetical protein